MQNLAFRRQGADENWTAPSFVAASPAKVSASATVSELPSLLGVLDYIPEGGTLSSKLSTSQSPSYADLPPPAWARLSRNFHKSQFLLGLTIDKLFHTYGFQRILFITLTMADVVRSTHEGHRRLNSLLNAVRKRYKKQYVWVMEPQGNGTIHYHILVPVAFDAHAGTDLDAWANKKAYDASRRRRAMNPLLQAESDWWEVMVPGYKFGITQVGPIHSNGDGVRKYLRKQEWRFWHWWPFEETKCFKFWACSRAIRAGTMDFSWNSPGARLCRARLRDWARSQGCHSLEDLRSRLGRHWGYRFFQYLQRLQAEASAPSLEEAVADGCASSRADIAQEAVPQAGCASSLRVAVGSERSGDPTATAEGVIYETTMPQAPPRPHFSAANHYFYPHHPIYDPPLIRS